MAKRKCKHCKVYTAAFITVPAGTFCDMDHALGFVNAAKRKATKKTIDIKRESVRWQHKQTQKVFNRMRVLEELKWFSDRGLEPTCISCGNPKGNDQWCCGHFKTVGAHGILRYERKNTNLQHNFRCNMNLSGDIKGYKKGIIQRFGDEGQAMIDFCETTRSPAKWKWETLQSMRKEFNARIRSLEDQARVSCS